MKRIALPQPKTQPNAESGFTLTELVAGLFVASMLVVGLADITRRYAVTTVRIKAAAADIRTDVVVRGLMSELERVNPDSLKLTSDRIEARIGSSEINAKLVRASDGAMSLQWSSPGVDRSISLPRTARFEKTAYGAILLLGDDGQPPLAIALPGRSAPFDCQFDTVTRACR